MLTIFDWLGAMGCTMALTEQSDWVQVPAFVGTVCFIICFITDITKENPA